LSNYLGEQKTSKQKENPLALAMGSIRRLNIIKKILRECTTLTARKMLDIFIFNKKNSLKSEFFVIFV
tara:strand:- start:287 stop:490 length:204 start_codon:yes stop_codon:yes gene_type:complete